MGAALFGVIGCQNNPPGVQPLPADHVIGYNDTPEASKAPPVNVPVGTPVGEDGTSSYATPTNPLPAGGLPAQAPPATQPDATGAGTK